KYATKPIVAPDGFFSFYFTQRAGNISSEVELKNHLFDISPNPAHHILNFKYQLLEPGKIKRGITDLKGKTIETICCKANTGINTLSIDVSAYASGMYFCN